MTTAGDGTRAARPIVSLSSANRDTVPLDGTEDWLGTEPADNVPVYEPGDEN